MGDVHVAGTLLSGTDTHTPPPPLPLPVTRCIYQSSPDSDIFEVLDPVYRGQHKFLNGQKKTCKDPPFLYTTPAPNRARSLPTTNRTSICNRICTVPCKPVSQVKNSSVQNLSGPWNGVSWCWEKKTLTKAEYRVKNFLAKFLREFVFADWRFFCLLRELIFVIRTNWFFSLGINICDSQKVPGTQHWWYFRAKEMNQKLIVFRFVSERKRQVVIEQTWFLSIVFLCSEFKLENISRWGIFLRKKMFAVIFICGNLFLRIAGKSQKLELAKISRHTAYPAVRQN